MIRAKIWFRCAVVHDPVCPVVVQPGIIGWEAKYRSIDLTIARAFKGEELIQRMNGWITVDPYKVIEIVNKYGKLKVLDNGELVIEVASHEDFENLQKEIGDAFGSEADIEIAQ